MSSTKENEIAQLEMKDLRDWKRRITVTKLLYALKRQTELTNKINEINKTTSLDTTYCSRAP